MAEFFETCDADEHIQDVCNKVKNQVQDYTNKKYDTFKAVKYRISPGIILVKIHVGGDDYVHIDVQPPTDGGGNFTVKNLEYKTKDDDLLPTIRVPEPQIIACDFGRPFPVTCDFGPPSGPDGQFPVMGGFSETRDADEEVQNLCNKVKEQVEARTNKKYETFKAVKYQSQTVAGTNYRVKIHAGGDSYLHVHFFRPLGSNRENVQLRSVVPKSKDDDLCAEPRIPQIIPCDFGRPVPLTCDFGPPTGPDEQFPVLGGFGETFDADEEIQKFCDKVKEQVESFKNKKYGTFKAVKYRKQTVQGTNYLVKVHAGNEDYLHIEFHHELECYGGVLELIGVDQKNKDDDLVGVIRYPDITVCGIGHITGPDEQFSVSEEYGEACDATDEIQELCDQVKKQVENFGNKKYETFKAVTYKTKTECEKKYMVKIHCGGDDYLHIEFSIALEYYGGGVVLGGFIQKTKDDDLLYVPSLVEMLPCAPFHPGPELLDIFVGEHSVVHDADDKIQEICNKIKHDVEEYSYEKYETFKVVKYQANAESADYRVKIHVGRDDYIHLEFCRGLPYHEGVAIYGVEHKAKDDILKPVQPESLDRSMIPGTD